MSDPATHNRRDIDNIWGLYPPCQKCGRTDNVEAHHIAGRGYSIGIRPNSKSRSAMSSILGCLPLCKNESKCHENWSSAEKKEWLNKIYDKVEGAIKEGKYEWKAADYNFYHLFAELYDDTKNKILPIQDHE